MRFPEEEISEKFDKGEISFEEAYKQLKNIIDKLERIKSK